jgi:adenylate cyclase
MGTLQKVGETYRIGLQLVRTTDGLLLWGHKYDLARQDLLSLQDAVAEEVAKALQIQMSAMERERVYRRYAGKPAAYELYLKGRANLLNRTEASYREAITGFEKAWAIDPNDALARAGLAELLALYITSYAPEADVPRLASRATDEARRALQQDPDLAEAHSAIGRVAATVQGGFNWRELLAETALALELNPNLDLAHLARANAFWHLGLFDQVDQGSRNTPRERRRGALPPKKDQMSP